MGGSCIVCGKKKSSGHKISLHRFSKKQEVRIKWLCGLSLTKGDITNDCRVCSIHLCEGDPSNIPPRSVGTEFAARPEVGS